ncbi:iron chelate uptake ABC transporter family permease subunit [Vibrio sp. PP-XX7]
MIESFIAYLSSQATSWDLQEVSLVNGEVLIQCKFIKRCHFCFHSVFWWFIAGRTQSLEALRLGEDTAAALGVNITLTRMTVMVCSVGLIAVATAVTGPIAFVAFLSGPIAARIVGSNGSRSFASALVGANLVLIGDYIGQFVLPSRYPVGVVTGALGASYLIYLIIRVNRERDLCDKSS